MNFGSDYFLKMICLIGVSVYSIVFLTAVVTPACCLPSTPLLNPWPLSSPTSTKSCDRDRTDRTNCALCEHTSYESIVWWVKEFLMSVLYFTHTSLWSLWCNHTCWVSNPTHVYIYNIILVHVYICHSIVHSTRIMHVIILFNTTHGSNHACHNNIIIIICMENVDATQHNLCIQATLMLIALVHLLHTHAIQ